VSRVPRPSPALSTRLLVAQVLVLLAAAVTAWTVAGLVGPPLFHDHLERAGALVGPDELRHAEEAFRSATVVALSVALLAAILAAVAGTLYVARRIGRSVGAVADAAVDVAGGRLDAKVPPPGLGPEFDALADSFNQMAARLESVEATRRRLLADLAHEMRTPVATLDGYLEGLEDGIATLDARTTALLRTQTQRLARLAEDMSAVSRAEERQIELFPRPINPVELVDAAVSAASARYTAKGVALHAVAPRALPRLVVDADRIGEVLGNLLDNALRHTPPGGEVTVSVGLTSARIGSARTGDRRSGSRSGSTAVQMTVSDTGEGIAAEHLAHVFERFYRVDPSRAREGGGAGIGLAISKALVEAHGGRISVASPGLGQGAAFTIRLPVA